MDDLKEAALICFFGALAALFVAAGLGVACGVACGVAYNVFRLVTS